MKNILCLLITLTIFCSAQSSDFNYKYGKVQQSDLEMTQYPLDKDAEAVILSEYISVYYLIDSHIKLVTEVSRKIKILNETGKDFANVDIPYSIDQDNKEFISGLDATAYNLENGKVTKTSLNKKFLFDEKISDHNFRKKFSIPNVKNGTVIEYKYKLTSDFFWNIPSINVQHSIPVVQSKFEVSVPQYFRFHINTRGYHPLNIVRTAGRSTIIGRADLNYNTSEIINESYNIPALKKESYVWCVDDYLSGIDFEISAVEMIGYYKYFSTDWAQVNKGLNQTSFGDNLKHKNPYKAEVEQIKNSTDSENKKVAAILELVQSKINWNGTRDIYTQNISEAVKKGIGSSADKNFILNVALKDAGFDVKPILLRPRDSGRITITHASQDNIKTFILKVTLSDNSVIYLDAADKYSKCNVLPTDLLVDCARSYSLNDSGDWVDLTSLCKNTKHSVINCSINEENEVVGTITNVHSNQFAYSFSSDFAKYKSDDEYIEHLEKEEDIRVDKFAVKNNKTTRCIETISFKKNINSTNDIIYLNATILPLISSNPFKDSDRKLPVEFPFKSNYIVTNNIQIPTGYEIEEMPKDLKITACNNTLSAIIQTSQSGATLTVNITFSCNQMIYPTTDFIALRSFFDELSQLCTSQIVLKKKNPAQ